MTEVSLEGFRTRGRDSTVRQGVPFFDSSRIERILTEQLDWTTLEERRKHSRLLMIYKLKNNIVRVDASSKLIPNERPSRNNNGKRIMTTTRTIAFVPTITITGSGGMGSGANKITFNFNKKPCPSRAKAGFKKSPSGRKVGF
jgi:hypothetical protein